MRSGPGAAVATEADARDVRRGQKRRGSACARCLTTAQKGSTSCHARPTAPEEIIGKLRQAEVLPGEGRKVPEVVEAPGVHAVTGYRFREEYGGIQVSQAKRLKELEPENARLRRTVCDLTLDRLILQGVALGPTWATDRRMGSGHAAVNCAPADRILNSAVASAATACGPQ